MVMSINQMVLPCIENIYNECASGELACYESEGKNYFLFASRAAMLISTVDNIKIPIAK